MLRYAEFADPAMERAFRLHNLVQDTRVLRRNLLGLMVFYLMPVALDFVYLDVGTVLAQMLPLRLGVYGLILAAMLLPAREGMQPLRHGLVMVLLAAIWGLAALVALRVDSPVSALTVSFFVMIIVLMNYLLLPTRWLWMTLYGVAASLVYAGLVMPLDGAPPSQIATALVMQTLANVFGSLTAFQLSSLRRMEYARRVQLEQEQARLQAANLELQRREIIIGEQRDQLARQVAELTQAQERLLVARDSLVQAEKLASLGQLVAGVAHELNTPMGIAVTAASHLSDTVGTLETAVRTRTLTRSAMDEHLETLREGARLVHANASRAAELIQGFKRVAVDQASAERRCFALDPYMQEVLASLGPRLKREPHRVELDCPSDIVMDSHPGALSQVLTNLVINACIHAYAPGQAGRITITAHRDGPDHVMLRFCDDGRGIPAENHNRVFDPFFTTNRAGGGSGLGLHIVFNLVTRTLMGSIHLESRPGAGTCFLLRLPLRPGRQADPPDQGAATREAAAD